MSGDADDPHAVSFTDEHGRRLGASGRPEPPHSPLAHAAADLAVPTGNWSHPTGEHMDPYWVSFNESTAGAG